MRTPQGRIAMRLDNLEELHEPRASGHRDWSVWHSVRGCRIAEDELEPELALS